MSAGVLIAGGGLAAQRCAEALRQGGYDGPVRLVSAETARAVRPSAALQGVPRRRAGRGRARAATRPAGTPSRASSSSSARRRAGLDPDARRLATASGAAFPTSSSSSRPAAAPAASPARTSTPTSTRSARSDDAARLRAALRPGRPSGRARRGPDRPGGRGHRRALAAPASCSSRPSGSRSGAPCTRTSASLARRPAARRGDRGPPRRPRDARSPRPATGSRPCAWRTATSVELDELLVAIGVQPNDDWLPAPLAELTARPEIHAAGDVAGGDHWELAAHQGRAAAHAILGREPRPAAAHQLVERRARRPAAGAREARPGADALRDRRRSRRSRSFTAVAQPRGRARGRPGRRPPARACRVCADCCNPPHHAPKEAA